MIERVGRAVPLGVIERQLACATTRILRLASVFTIDALADLDLAGATAQRIRRKGVMLGRSASAAAIRDVVLGRDPIGASARRPQTDVGMQERPASTPAVQVMVGPERRSNG